MKAALIATVIAGVAAVLGWTLQAQPYRLDRPGSPSDQQVLSHADSGYASSAWVASPAENYFELRFFDRVEGGICLRPSWADVRTLALRDPRLSHLVPQGEIPAPAPAERTWRFDWLPDPGPLPHTKYVSLFPAAVLLDKRLMDESGGDPRAAKADICVVGLGSGVGIAVFAHHFPQASITVVDIDETVIRMVRAHYPLLRWLETQQTSDGRPRLRMVAQDARKFIRRAGRDGQRWHVIVLDAYTSGSTIPPHLMTREFYGQCADALADGGILMSNIIGAYQQPAQGSKHLVLGGAIRSMIEAGLTHVRNLPVPRYPGFDPAQVEPLDTREVRNNVVLASRSPIGPRSATELWNHARSFAMFPEFSIGAHVSRVVLVDDSTTVDFSTIEAREPGFLQRLTPRPDLKRGVSIVRTSEDRAVIAAAYAAVAAGGGGTPPPGWREASTAKALVYLEIDWVQYARATWVHSFRLATDPQHAGEQIVGTDDEERRASLIPDAPLFTDDRPNADIYNTGY